VFEQHLAQAGYMPQTIKGYVSTLHKLQKELGGLLGPPATLHRKLAAWREKQQQALDAGTLKPATVRADITALRTWYDVMGEAGLSKAIT
jgi:hypothetical protein